MLGTILASMMTRFSLVLAVMVHHWHRIYRGRVEMLEYESLSYYYSVTLPAGEYILFVKDKPGTETLVFGILADI
jgi:hypothetical protein